MDPIVIVGSGLAGYTVARELRKRDAQLPLVILSRDEASFYSKPMLSNALAAGKSAAQLASASAEQMAAELKAEVRAGIEVEAIDPAQRSLHFANSRLAYSKLVLALGADPISIGLDGDAADEVLRVNDLAGYARFRAAIEGKRTLALLGAGLIGCEFANDLAMAGYRVHVIDSAPRPLVRLLPEAAADALRAALEAQGVQWHLGTTARALKRAGAGPSLELADGTALAVDVVLSAIGLTPRTGLARRAGLKVGRGIVTDRWLCTGAEDIYALGDCAEVEGQVLPYVLPLMQAARALAQTLVGTPTPVAYPAMPVVVKTPALPLVACAPVSGEGSWKVQVDAAGIEARCEDASGKLLGFALTGKAITRKQALTKLAPPVFS